MKARIKDTGQILEVMTVKLENGFYYSLDKIEFEQEPNNTSDHWKDVRERAAIAAMRSIIPIQQGKYMLCDAHRQYSDCAEESVKYADSLVKKLKGE